MKEYISQKFTPGEDDRELSRVISKAISPRKASSEAGTFNGATNMVPASNSSDNKAPILANTNESEFLFLSLNKTILFNHFNLHLYSDSFVEMQLLRKKIMGRCFNQTKEQSGCVKSVLASICCIMRLKILIHHFCFVFIHLIDH